MNSDHTIFQQQFLEQLTTTLVTDYRAKGGQIFCDKGCSNCCSLVVNCSFPEAQLLAVRLDESLLQQVDRYAERLKELSSGITELKDYLRRHRRESGGCPLLGSDGACRAYSLRPLSCRALLATKESRWCGADFAALTAADKETFAATLDRAVTAFPLHYLVATQDAARALESQTLQSMILAHGFSLYGNMPLMVHLASRWRLAETLPAGAAAVRGLLHKAGLDHPLLMELEEL